MRERGDHWLLSQGGFRPTPPPPRDRLPSPPSPTLDSTILEGDREGRRREGKKIITHRTEVSSRWAARDAAPPLPEVRTYRE
ncbi:hypothetical protein E2C01_065512 [Portunus trituberculatus]|uniref:Uncharacterized protein n=1 Tax=Portunus trituberculatus TaxID=210409 RepID=A0A5B7HFS3_PORTR|nr:hypothetical protein [Portunus trituberculatus]